MKKIQALSFIFLTFNCAIIYGQQDTSKKSRNFIYKNLKIENIQFVIKTDLLGPVISLIDKRRMNTLTGEICFNNKHSIQLTGLYNNYQSRFESEFILDIIPEYKFFLERKKSYTGFYTGAYLKLRNSTFEYVITYYKSTYYYDYNKYNQTSFGGGIICCGYQNHIRKNIVFDFLFGIGGQYIVKVNNSFIENHKISRDIRFALNLGYKF
jgi:hypothetical protein